MFSGDNKFIFGEAGEAILDRRDRQAGPNCPVDEILSIELSQNGMDLLFVAAAKAAPMNEYQ